MTTPLLKAAKEMLSILERIDYTNVEGYSYSSIPFSSFAAAIHDAQKPPQTKILSEDSEGASDYTLSRDGDTEGVWITVDGYSLRIGRRPEGEVQAQAYHYAREMEMPLCEFTLPPK